MIGFEEFSKNIFLTSEDEVVPFFFEDKKFWLKKARDTKAKLIQKFFYIIAPFELLIPPQKKNKQEALKYEVSKLENLYKLGVNVPKVIYSCSEYFVLEDSGKSVYSYLKEQKVSQKEFWNFTDMMLKELAKIHNNNFFHGGSQLRNFTYKDEKVYVIDFEESFNKNSLESLQYRDLLLFLLSFIKLKNLDFQVDYSYIINSYIALTNNKNFLTKLKNLAKNLRFFIYLCEIGFIKKRVGSDVLHFIEFIKKVNEIE